MKIAVLDDYQNVALDCADWSGLNAGVEVFSSHIPDVDELVSRLAGFEAVVAMRERTPFTADVLGRLPDLKLLVTTGPRNAAIDLAAAARHGVVVCGTGYYPEPTVELTWALILAAVRNLPTEERSMRDEGWQRTLGTELRGRTLGLLGLGNLGSRVARIGQAFGMDTIAWSENLTPGRAAEHGVRAVTKEELFALRGRVVGASGAEFPHPRAGRPCGTRRDEAVRDPGEHLARPPRRPGRTAGCLAPRSDQVRGTRRLRHRATAS